MAQKRLEIIATSLADVVDICNSDADRIELVDDLKNGGLTPTLPLIEAAVKASTLPINVMLRPHSKSFVYNDDEFASILNQLTKINKLKYKPAGIVYGSLTKSIEINEGQLKKIIAVKQDLELVFHRAFDQLKNHQAGIEIINRYPQVNGLLSSGTKAKATEGKNELKQMVEQAKTVNILVGSGVNLENITVLNEVTNAPWFHVGTAVRSNKSVEGKIDIDEINKLKNLLS